MGIETGFTMWRWPVLSVEFGLADGVIRKGASASPDYNACSLGLRDDMIMEWQASGADVQVAKVYDASETICMSLSRRYRSKLSFFAGMF